MASPIFLATTRTYLELMRHWDTVLPWRILRVCTRTSWKISRESGAHPRLLRPRIRTGLRPVPQMERAVPRTSSEQGSPANFRHGLFQWKNYEA
jgi:hypothetical protein